MKLLLFSSPNQTLQIYIIVSIDNIAFRFYNNASLWWVIAQANGLGKGRREQDFYKIMMKEIKKDGWKQDSDPAKIMIIKYIEDKKNWSAGLGLHDGNHRMTITKLNNIDCDIPIQIEGYRKLDSHKTNHQRNNQRSLGRFAGRILKKI